MSFVRFRKPSLLLFNISKIPATDPSIRTNEYKFTTSKEVCILLSDIYHSFASSTNEDQYMTLFLFLFKVGCIIFTKYFVVSYDGDPKFETNRSSSLVYVPLKFHKILVVYTVGWLN